LQLPAARERPAGVLEHALSPSRSLVDPPHAANTFCRIRRSWIVSLALDRVRSLRLFSPLAEAGWFGCLLTAINLLPIG
jgi:hypothetical protein